VEPLDVGLDSRAERLYQSEYWLAPAGFYASAGTPPPTTTTGSSSMQCPWYLLQAKSTRDPIDLEDMFEQKLAELQRVNTTDGLKENEKYVELLEHIQNAVESAGG